MKEKIKENFKGSKGIVALIIGVGTLLIATFGAAYAYFSVTASNNATNTTSTGALQSTGNVTLETNTPNLYLNLDGVLMSEGNVGTKYWATTDTSGTPITTPTQDNGIYTLATVSLASGETQYNCTYNYDLSATVNTPITDGSDEDIKVTIKGSSIIGGEETYTLKDILAGGQTLTGLFKRVTAGESQTITIESTVENTSRTQDDFAGNNYSITLTPKSGSDGFSCTLPPEPVGLAKELIDNHNMWQSGLEGDGYRFTGSGNAESSTSPDNFICFGTTSVTDCKANEEKYLYRIIGVFEDNQGNNSVKLIKYKQLPTKYAWHNTNDDVPWESSDMYNGLNGSYFLTNTTFDYMQNTDWTNKIANWTWSAVNTLTNPNSVPNYYSITTQNMYLHEMNRASKTSSIGSWTTPLAKIGLMYVSDYQMSLGVSSLAYTSESNYTTLKTGWMHQSNNDTTASTYEWTISRIGGYGDWFAWYVYSFGCVNNGYVNSTNGARPVFYLTSDTTYTSGSGGYSDPIIIN